MTELQSVVDQFGTYIYKSPLIYFRRERIKNYKHRDYTVEQDPNANAFICKLDEEIFTENPIFEPDILNIDNPENKTILKEWQKESWIDLLITIFNTARTHRFCVVNLYDEEPYWKVFYEHHIKKIYYDAKGNPVSCKVEWTESLPKSNEHKEYKETIYFNTDRNMDTIKYSGLFIPFGVKKKNKLGQCDLESIWDLLIYIRYQMLDIVNNSAKTSGFFHFVYGNAIREDQKTELKNALDYVGIGQAVGAKEQVLLRIDYHTPDHPEFTVEAMNESLNILAGCTRLPLSFFRGEKEGGGVFQEGFSDEAKITKKKKYIFSQFKKYIMRLVKMRWGKEVDDVQPYIEEELAENQQFENEASNQFEQDHFKDKPNTGMKKIA
jgi:hypothetical protein